MTKTQEIRAESDLWKLLVIAFNNRDITINVDDGYDKYPINEVYELVDYLYSVTDGNN